MRLRVSACIKIVSFPTPCAGRLNGCCLNFRLCWGEDERFGKFWVRAADADPSHSWISRARIGLRWVRVACGYAGDSAAIRFSFPSVDDRG